MSEEFLNSKQEQIDAIRRERDQLVEQVRQCQETIARAGALIERLNGMLNKLDQRSG